MSARSHALTGLTLLAAHLVAVLATTGTDGLPTLPLYDGAGYAPPTYRWVSQPNHLPAAPLPPTPREAVVDLEGGPAGLTVASDDGQVIIVILEGGMSTDPGSEIVLTIEPLDPSRFPPPPAGMRFDSNAYRITAVNSVTGDRVSLAGDRCPSEAQPTLCPTLLMRYAVRGTDILRLDQSRWVTRPTTPVFPTLQAFTQVDRLGVYVVVGPDAGFPTTPDRTRSVLSIVLAVSAGLNLVLWKRRRTVA